MASDKQIKQLFVREELDRHGEHLIDLLTDAIESKNLIDTSQLLQSLKYQIKSEGDNYILQLIFMSYGRAFEIQSHKRRSKSFIEDTRSTNEVLLGIRRKKPEDKRWYAKNVYGSLNLLIGRLMFGLTEETRERLVGILEGQAKRGFNFKSVTTSAI